MTASATARAAASRRNALWGTVTPAAAGGYALATLDRPHRAAMLVVCAVLVAVAAVMSLTAVRVARHRGRRRVVDLASVVVHVAGAAALGYLDGGVASPLSVLLYGSLPMLATMTTLRRFVGYGTLVVAAYGAVAVLGGPSPDGYPIVYTLGFVCLAVSCAMHSRSLASLRRRLDDVCRVDPLTGCLNRRGFDDRLDAELSRSRRTGEPVALLLLDLDGFKEVNDRDGHAAGDGLLVWTGRVLAETLRGRDAVGRVGGDEFAVLLPNATLERGLEVEARVRAALDVRSPASIGTAVHEPAAGLGGPGSGGPGSGGPGPDGSALDGSALDGRGPDRSVRGSSATSGPASDADDLRRAADARLYEDKVRRRGTSALRPPTAAVPIRRAAVRTARVAANERRTHALGQIGWLAAIDFAIGLLYAVLFADQAGAVRWVILFMTAFGTLLGLATVAAAGRLAASSSAHRTMLGVAAVQFLLVVTVVVLDGGVRSPLALGLLTPLPLIALSTPPRTAGPVAGTVAAVYVVLAVVVPGTSGWYAAIHLVVFVAISVACAAKGRTAALQRASLTLQSRSDPLTGCLNRRGVEEGFAAAVETADDTGVQVSVLLLDLDDFKRVNDTAGHAAGDELLVWVAATVAGTLRGHDRVGRLGGDEFVALLVDCPADQAAGVAVRVRAALAERVSASLGTATLGAHGDDLEALYSHADLALYAEKSARTPSRRPQPIA